MADVSNRYPLSTADGQYIPLDVVRPHGSLTKTFTAAGSTAAMDVPSTVDIMTFLCDQDCILQFAASSASAAAMVDGTLKADAFFVYANTITNISPPIGKKSFALRGDSASGIAKINYLETWAGLSLQSQITRR